MTNAVAIAQGGSIGNVYGFKNRLINGNFNIWQRGTSYSNPANGQYGADRWAMLWGSANRTHSRQTGFSGAPYCYRVQKNAGASDTSYSNLFQIIESINMYDLQGQTVTLSFSARCGSNYSSSGNALLVGLNTGTVADQGFGQYWSPGWTGVASPISSSVTLTTTAQTFSITCTIPNGALEAGISFQYVSTGGAAGANDYFEITNIQLELGSVATAYDNRPYGLELMLCQRYCLQMSPAGGQIMFIGLSGGSGHFVFMPPVRFRAVPTITLTTTAPYWESYPWSIAGTSLTGLTASNGHLGVDSGEVYLSGTFNPGLTRGVNYTINANTFIFSAEL